MKKRILRVGVLMLGILTFIMTLIYINIKTFTVKEVALDNGQEIYLMGSFHEYHFKKYANFSIDELLAAVNSINPDVVFIESRDEYYQKYGVIDGSIEMGIVYSYCKQKDIPVEMVDYWIVDNDWLNKQNTTDTIRDDRIHENIMNKLKLHDNQKVLIICDWGHLKAQTDRLVNEGASEIKIENKGSLFKTSDASFAYPAGTMEVLESRWIFYGKTYAEIINADSSLSDEIKSAWPISDEKDIIEWVDEKYQYISENDIYNQ